MLGLVPALEMKLGSSALGERCSWGVWAVQKCPEKPCCTAGQPAHSTRGIMCWGFTQGKSFGVEHPKLQLTLKRRGADEMGTTGTTCPHSHTRGILTHIIQPMDQMSTSKLCPFLPSTSGAM